MDEKTKVLGTVKNVRNLKDLINDLPDNMEIYNIYFDKIQLEIIKRKNKQVLIIDSE